MKTSNPFLFSLMVGIIFTACKKDLIQPNSNSPQSSEEVTWLRTEVHLPPPGGDSQNSDECNSTFDLIAGNNSTAGFITVENNGTSLSVTYNTTEGWVLNETHLYVGALEGIPTTGSGNPKIGHFPSKDEHNGATSFTVEFPLDPNIECYAIAAHAEVSLIENGNVIQQAGAWSEGNQINNGNNNWAMYSEYCLSNCCAFAITELDLSSTTNPYSLYMNLTNDFSNLYLKLSTKSGFYLKQSFLFVGKTGDIPISSNLINLAAFPFNTTHSIFTQEYEYVIPLDDLGDCNAVMCLIEIQKLDISGTVLSTEQIWIPGNAFYDGSYLDYCNATCE